MGRKRDETPQGEYTRFAANIQLGDGIDRRGDVTVEIVREVEEDRRETTVTLPTGAEDDAVYLAEGTVDGVPANDQTFAEFYNELMRSRNSLQEALGLDAEGEDDD